MLAIDLNSPVPLNDQIKAGLKGLVAKGLLKPGDKAPSVRGLATMLKVNPNTVARAFRELQLEGFLESRQGDGNYIAHGAKSQAKEGLVETRDRLRDAIRLAQQSGLKWEDVLNVVRSTRGGER